MRYNRIPIFIPQMGCPHACVYCNQREITGFAHSLDPEDIYKIIDLHLASLSKESSVEIAFFGGNFTAIPWPLQQAYLQQSQKYIEKGLVSGIRFSTRPDDIQEFRLPIYKAYGVNTIELGAQSLNDRVLSLSGRGHSKAEVEIASEKIKQAGLRLGLQMMIGLPEDTLERALETASEIIRLKADETRIYPTLVIEHTLLAQWYRQGKYRPLPLEEAIEWTCQLIPKFEEGDVRIIRVGLHPSQGLLSHQAYLAGPFHPSFRELAESRIWLNLWKKEHEKILGDTDKVPKNKVLRLYVAPKEVNVAVGYHGENRLYLKQYFKEVHVYGREGLKNREWDYDLGG